LGINFDAVRINSSRLLSLSATQSGVQGYDLIGRTTQRSSPLAAAEDFLLASRLGSNDIDFQLSVKSYFNDSATFAISHVDELNTAGEPEVHLPDPGPLSTTLQKALSTRRSNRQYTGDAIPLVDLSAVLQYACGITAQADTALENGDTASLALRSYPSAGGLFGIQIWIRVNNVDSLSAGLYRYSPLKSALYRVKNDDSAAHFRACFTVPEEIISISRANCVILMIGRPWRFLRKYGPRGLRFLYYEAGAISQNIHLVAASLGVGSVDCSSVIDDAIHEYLAIDGLYTTFVHSVIIGEYS
jgi:SagB-type dehydrogenase family enzyme